MPAHRALPAAIVVLGLVAASSTLNAKQPDEVVARLGATELRVSQVQALLAQQPVESRARRAGSRELLERLLRTELYRRALAAEARAKAWDKRPEVIAQMDQAREQALVAAYMNTVARPAADYPDEPSVRALYDATQAALTVPRQFRVAQVYIAAGDASAAEARQRKAQDIAAQLRAAPGGFADQARAHSEHAPSAQHGGDIGWVTETELLPELRDAVAAATRDAIIGPLRSAQGWHVVKVLDIRPERVRPFEEVREVLVAALRARRAQENERRHLDEMVVRTPLSIDELALGSIGAEGARP